MEEEENLKEVWGGVEEALVVEEEWKELEVMEGQMKMEEKKRNGEKVGFYRNLEIVPALRHCLNNRVQTLSTKALVVGASTDDIG